MTNLTELAVTAATNPSGHRAPILPIVLLVIVAAVVVYFIVRARKRRG
jgi:hypothetical protein